MRPICTTCHLEMSPQGSTKTVGYMHDHAPVDYSRATEYKCLGCGTTVLVPFGYCYEMAIGEPKDYVPVKPFKPPLKKDRLP